MAIVGIGLSLILLALYGWLLVVIYRAPFKALAVLVAGMAFHNVVLMTLLNLGTPTLLVRLVQFWKEGVLILLLFLACRLALQAWRAGKRPRLSWLDWTMVAFAALACIYLVIPAGALPIDSSLGQRFVSFRVMMLMPLLYAFGRVFWRYSRPDLVWTARVLFGSVIAVALFGLWELWFVPTVDWVGWGVKGFTSLLGYEYQGPGGLPENFFQSTESGLGLRRMVSTYISPLGLAYTGLLLVPICAVLVSFKGKEPALPGWFRWTALVLLVTSILFSVTRGALLAMLGEFALLALLLRRWRIVAVGSVVALAVLFIFIEYANFGPLVTFKLEEARPPLGQALVREVLGGGLATSAGPVATPTSVAGGSDGTEPDTSRGELLDRMLSSEDPSMRGHMAALRAGLNYVIKYPFGTGLGSSVPRFGDAEGPAESALLAIPGEMGILGGLLYLLMYGASLVYSFLAYLRVRGDHIREALTLVPLVGGLALVPIMITSAIWGNFSVSFLFWWTAGFCVSLALQRKDQADSAPVTHEDTVELTPQEQERDDQRLAVPHTV